MGRVSTSGGSISDYDLGLRKDPRKQNIGYSYRTFFLEIRRYGVGEGARRGTTGVFIPSRGPQSCDGSRGSSCTYAYTLDHQVHTKPPQCRQQKHTHKITRKTFKHAIVFKGYISFHSTKHLSPTRYDYAFWLDAPIAFTPMRTIYTIQAAYPSIYPSSTPLSFKLRNSSGSRNLLIVTSSARPFLLRVLRTKSRANCWAVAGSSGRVVMSLSRGSPGTIDQRSKTRERETRPCVWICDGVSCGVCWMGEECTYP